jgi:DNA-binding beta-propeller fold protein YncE
LIIDPRHEKILNSIPEDANCSANGLAIGPGHQILLGCNLPTEAAVLDDRTNTITTIPGQGGSDEVWFNPGDGHYFLAESSNSPPRLGIVDSRTGNVDQDITTGASAHSVAADPVTNQAYVPIKGGTATICGTFANNASDAAADNANGCIAIFGPTGPDDHPVFVAREHRDHD